MTENITITLTVTDEGMRVQATTQGLNSETLADALERLRKHPSFWAFLQGVKPGEGGYIDASL